MEDIKRLNNNETGEIKWEDISEVKNIEQILQENPDVACTMSRKKISL